MADLESKFISTILVQKGPKSSIWPWLQTVPKSYGTVLAFWPDKFNNLLLPLMREKKEETYSLMDESWQEIDRVYNKKVEDMQYADGSPVKQISRVLKIFEDRIVDFFKFPDRM